jgi:hypothetical protein
MKKLTAKNYHQPNKYLTTSKIKDFIIDERYFYEKHVLHTVEEEKTDAMTTGSMVDVLVMYGSRRFRRDFKIAARRNKADPPAKYTEVTQAMYDEAVRMAGRVMETKAYKELDKFERQVVLTMPLGTYMQDNGLFCGFSGMLDFLKVDYEGEKAVRATIVDLKTAKTIHPIRYYWQTEEFLYWLQAASYVRLVSYNHTIPLSAIDFYHLAVEKDPKDLHHVATFKFDMDKIMENLMHLDRLSELICTKKEFVRRDVSFDDAFILRGQAKAEDVKE